MLIPTRAKRFLPTGSENFETALSMRMHKLFNLRAHNFLHQRDKLIAAVTRQKIILTQLSLDQVSHFAQHLVADLVTVTCRLHS